MILHLVEGVLLEIRGDDKSSFQANSFTCENGFWVVRWVLIKSYTSEGKCCFRSGSRNQLWKR